MYSFVDFKVDVATEMSFNNIIVAGLPLMEGISSLTLRMPLAAIGLLTFSGGLDCRAPSLPVEHPRVTKKEQIQRGWFLAQQDY